jgi:hypothetical protein
MKRLIFLLALLLLPFSLRAQNINTLDPMDNDTVDESGIDPWTDWTGKFVDGHVVKTSPALDTTGWEYKYDYNSKCDTFISYGWYHYTHDFHYEDINDDGPYWGSSGLGRKQDSVRVISSMSINCHSTYKNIIDSTPIVEPRSSSVGNPNIIMSPADTIPDHPIVKHYMLDSAEYAALKELIALWESFKKSGCNIEEKP